jgi:non-specific serine/threonine protein kinase
VLDNCEHVVDACAGLADLLLRGEPGLRILATSREALGVAGERSWFVPPLATPPAGADQAAALADVDAVRLFVDRRATSAPEFALTEANAAAVAGICRRLDGLPLGLVLAGARVRVLTPQQIAERLASSFEVLAGRARGAPSRQQTLHAAVDWSYRLLAPPEQALLQRLSVFAGGVGLDDVEAVCAENDGQRPAVLDLLAALVEKSLVVMREDAGAARYSLLEPVRQYAAGRLRESGADAAVRDRHASYFVCWAVAAEPVIYSGGSDPARFTALDAQLGNLRAAAEWLATRADGGEAGLRLATALEWYWFIRGRSREGRQWLQTALTHAGPVSALTRARALAALAMQAFCHGDLVQMRAAAGEAVALLRGLDAPVPLAYALTLLGAATAVLDDAEGAQRLLHEAVALGRAHDARVLVTVLTFAGFVARVRNDPAAAQRAWEEALGLARALHLPYAALHLTAGLGRLASAQDDAALARARFGEALASHVAADDLWGLALILGGQAAVAILEDRPATAARLLGAARAVRDGSACPPGPTRRRCTSGSPRGPGRHSARRASRRSCAPGRRSAPTTPWHWHARWARARRPPRPRRNPRTARPRPGRAMEARGRRARRCASSPSVRSRSIATVRCWPPARSRTPDRASCCSTCCASPPGAPGARSASRSGPTPRRRSSRTTSTSRSTTSGARSAATSSWPSASATASTPRSTSISTPWRSSATRARRSPR